jgi:hypothetical protein
MFELEKRKSDTKWSIRQIEAFFLNCTNKREYAGLYLVGVHYLIVTGIVACIFFGDMNIYYYISVFCYSLLVILHHYYNGCILTKTERSLFDTKIWYGPPSMLLYGVEDFTMERCNDMIYYLSSVVIINIAIREYNKDINLWFLLLLIVIFFRMK